MGSSDRTMLETPGKELAILVYMYRKVLVEMKVDPL